MRAVRKHGNIPLRSIRNKVILRGDYPLGDRLDSTFSRCLRDALFPFDVTLTDVT